MSILKHAAFAVLAVLSAAGHAATGEGTIDYFGFYGNGRLMIDVSVKISDPVCPNDRIDIEPTHPQLKQITAVVSLAMATGKAVTFKTAGCYGSYPTFGRTTDSYIYISR